MIAILYIIKKKTNDIKFIKKNTDINFNIFEYIFTNYINKWNESSTIKVRYNSILYSLGEFQIHTNRNCIKFRWNLNTILDIFKDNFTITNI